MPGEAPMPMGRRAKQAALEVLVSFEPARIAAECLARAYKRVLPIHRRPARPDGYRRQIAGQLAARVGEGTLGSKQAYSPLA